MIASPGDVVEERRLAREVIADWNAVHASDRGQLLLPVGWDTDATPEMGSAAQDVINWQLLRKSDLLVAVFWTKLGTPTKDSQSGTVEEIDRHTQAGKPAMLYFSKRPVAQTDETTAQYHQLKAFREASAQKGLYQEFASLEEFRTLFSRQLAQEIIQHFPIAATPTVPTVASRRSPGALSKEAADLLAAAAAGDGHILNSLHVGGRSVHVGSREFVGDSNPRSAARWDAAVQELRSSGLIKQLDAKGEVFQVTHAGFAQADQL
jgi:hypothetical protein